MLCTLLSQRVSVTDETGRSPPAFSAELHRCQPKSLGILSLAKRLPFGHLRPGEHCRRDCDKKTGENANQRPDSLGLPCQHFHNGCLCLRSVSVANCRPGCSLHHLLNILGEHIQQICTMLLFNFLKNKGKECCEVKAILIEIIDSLKFL